MGIALNIFQWHEERGDRMNPDTTALETATTIVQDFLRTMEARDLPKAETFLAADFTMEFPGGNRFTNLADLVTWAGSRYRGVRKAYQQVNALHSNETIVVYCIGTLSGEWPDGTTFSGIRFLDRFVVRDGKLLDQKVWNDLAEARP